ncbi:beta-lactamase transpeptidase [Lecanosticta acicola]|uniref:Beta-lactamase transpeptidase n=1 Tax=Lecanosticta acicola TaxID=111012 RepID=A0AAI8Z2V8_9PEZI|nr:beta-lactamase transpeptidase [Lecanosticta acicola]
MSDLSQRAREAIESIPSRFRGPGGAIAVLQNGQPIHEHAWGFADLDQRIPLSAHTKMPICSITKQMVCMLLFDLISNPTPAMVATGRDVWDLLCGEFETFLPNGLGGKKIALADLCNNQSGIRDYWAMSTLWGARPEDRFSLDKHAPEALKRTTSLHFEPGTEYSYCNFNFYILARLLERVSGVPLQQLLTQRLFEPAGMTTASLIPDTAQLPQPCIGYEGDVEHGFHPATNRIEWSGDAGVVVTLKDMIAYEQHLDRSWNDPKSPYRRIAEPQTYKDGHSAPYGYGLARGEVGGKTVIGHGGALRGFRLHRAHMPSERLSIVVLFNHEADAGGAAKQILQQLLGVKQTEQKSTLRRDQLLHWEGDFLDVDTQLAIQITPGEGNLSIAYTRAGGSEKVRPVDPDHARSESMEARIGSEILHINRHKENRVLVARRIVKRESRSDHAGEYYSADADSTFHCSGQGALLHGAFDGFLGKGPEHLMRSLGADVYALSNPRGMDAPAPGDWTCAFHRDGKGQVAGVTIGCWLARKLEFVKRCDS